MKSSPSRASTKEAPCPILGLSATIGKPKEFNGWLALVQEQCGSN